MKQARLFAAELGAITWREQDGATVHEGEVLAQAESKVAVYASHTGTLHILETHVDDIGTPVALIDVCDHPMDYGGICVKCGTDVTVTACSSRRTQQVGGEHKLNVTSSALSTLSANNTRVLTQSRKLLLVLDLDHTVLHATMDPRAKDLLGSPLGSNLHIFESNQTTHYIKLRPYALEFLAQLSDLYDVRVYTLGMRHYAQHVVSLLDPSETLIKARVVARDDVEAGPGPLPQKQIETLCPVDLRMALIVDDDPRVWGAYKRNLLRVPKYHFFPLSVEFAHGEAKQEQGSAFDTQVLETNDKDNVLVSFTCVLQAISNVYYASPVPEETFQPDARELLDVLRSTVLKGTCLAFSGFIPLHSAFEDCVEVKLARMFGAICSETVTESVTHLIAASTGSAKYRQALQLGIPVVHPNWLWKAVTHFKRMKDDEFNLKTGPTAPFYKIVRFVPDPPTTEELEDTLREALLWIYAPEMVRRSPRLQGKRKAEADPDMDDFDLNAFTHELDEFLGDK